MQTLYVAKFEIIKNGKRQLRSGEPRLWKTEASIDLTIAWLKCDSILNVWVTGDVEIIAGPQHVVDRAEVDAQLEVYAN